MIALWWIVLRKMLRISKQNRITSLADFIASRYGKSALLGGLVTVIAVIGILPYISLQLKAISTSFTILVQYPEIIMPAQVGAVPIRQDTALWVALILAAFTIAFGTRHLDAAEHHQGLVAAIAFESVVKLLAFLAVGVFVTFGMYDGFGDVFARAAAEPKLRAMMTPLEGVGSYGNWVWLTILSMMAIMFLPRQFQVAVIENLDEKHLNKAIWLFPLYMLAINVFVLPIAFGAAEVATPAAERAPRSHRAADRYTARCNCADPFARLSVLQAGGRSLCAGFDRTHFVRRSGAIRASDPRGHILERGHPRRGIVRSARRLCRLALYPAPARACSFGMAASRSTRAGTVRYCVVEAAGAVRTVGTRRD